MSEIELIGSTVVPVFAIATDWPGVATFRAQSPNASAVGVTEADAEAAPELTTRFTAEPFATPVPAAGLWLITLPAGTVALDCCVTVPTTSPAFVMAVAAAACVSPTTFARSLAGHSRRSGPPPTGRNGRLAIGFWLITLPAGTVALDCSVTAPIPDPRP